MKGSRLCVFTSGSFAYDHFQLNDINSDLLFALGAKKRKIHQNGIRIHFGSRFAVAYGASDPQRIIKVIIHVYTSDYGIALRSTSGIFHYLLSKLGCMGFEGIAGLWPIMDIICFCIILQYIYFSLLSTVTHILKNQK